MEPGIQTPEETLKLGSGSCRDSAWLLVQMLAAAGACGALRLRLSDSAQTRRETARRAASGRVTTSRTCMPGQRCTCPAPDGLGSIRLPVCLPGEGHIPLAATPEPQSAAPVSGLVSECEVEFVHEMQVTRIHEDPRVTKPYTEDQWERMCAVGDQIDDEFAAGDVRLTMGGEPTFVSIDDMDGEEWNTAALGPAKLRLGSVLLKRLRRQLRSRRLPAFRTGQVVSGRIAAPMGVQLLLAHRRITALERCAMGRRSRSRLRIRRGRCPAVCGRSLARRCRSIRITSSPPTKILWPMLERTAACPSMSIRRTTNSMTRKNANGFAAFLNAVWASPSGLCLPLQRGYGKHGPEWQTGLWMLRARHLFLVPGDSPVGFRLPLAQSAMGTRRANSADLGGRSDGSAGPLACSSIAAAPAGNDRCSAGLHPPDL